jgi:hypothetical protein
MGGREFVVRAVSQSEHGDYGIHLRTHASSCYLIVLDHIENLIVAEEDTVSAGQVLGTPGLWSTYAGQFETQVNDERNDAYICPVDLIAPAQKAAVEASVTQLMADWEALKADTGIFDEAAMSIPGCVTSSIPFDALPD